MEVSVQNDHLIVSLFEPEATLLLNAFLGIAQIYEHSLDELEDFAKKAWYQNPEKSGMSEKEAQEWKFNLHEFRQGHAKHIHQWIEAISGSSFPVRWKIQEDEIENLLMVLNDHRLYRAAEFDVTEAEMSQNIEEIPNIPRKMALIEIHFLGWLMEVLLKKEPFS